MSEEEENQCGSDQEPGGTSDNTSGDGTNVTRRSTTVALLIVAFVGRNRCGWWGVGSRRSGGGSSFWIPPNRFCERGVELALCLIQ